jgi:hypothetical protein
MPNYRVHLYPIIRVTVRDVEAEDQVAAKRLADSRAQLVHRYRAQTDTCTSLVLSAGLPGSTAATSAPVAVHWNAGRGSSMYGDVDSQVGIRLSLAIMQKSEDGSQNTDFGLLNSSYNY